MNEEFEKTISKTIKKEYYSDNWDFYLGIRKQNSIVTKLWLGKKMSEYKNEVALSKRKKLEAEKWAGKVKYLEARDGYLETAYNSGHITKRT